MVSYEELLNAPVTDLPSKTLIDAWYDGTKHMRDFSQEVMLPVLKQLLRPTEQEAAVRDNYYRLFFFLRSIVDLNRLDHFQSVASAARSIFELWIDLELLARDTTGRELRMYNGFAELERYRRAEQIVKFADANPNALRMDVTPQRAFSTDRERQRRLAATFGLTRAAELKFRNHWSNKDLRERARQVGQEAMYMQVQPLLSWYVHSGSAGTAGIGREGFEAVFALSHMLTQKIFVAATETCAKVTKISALADFERWMQELRLKTGELIVAEQMKQLEEKQRQSPSSPG